MQKKNLIIISFSFSFSLIVLLLFLSINTVFALNFPTKNLESNKQLKASSTVFKNDFLNLEAKKEISASLPESKKEILKSSTLETKISPNPEKIIPLNSQNTQIKIGARVKILPPTANVRENCGGNILGQGTQNQLGNIVEGPQTCGGLERWKITFDSGLSGWVAKNDGVSDLFGLVVFAFEKDDFVVSTVDGDGVDSGLIVRTSACGSTIVRRVAKNTKGKIISTTPNVATNCVLGSQNLYWWNIQWYDTNGNIIATGWSAENYLQKAPVLDITAPTVSVMADVSNNLYDLNNKNSFIQIQASDTQSNISFVELYLNGSFLKNATYNNTSKKWEASLNQLPVGTYNLQARAADAANNMSLSQNVTLNILNWQSPNDQASVSGEILDQKYSVNLNSFQSGKILVYSGKLEITNSCTQIKSTSLAFNSTTSKWEISFVFQRNVTNGQFCTTGTNILPFDVALYNVNLGGASLSDIASNLQVIGL